MKKKLILICLLGAIAIFFIYRLTINNKAKILALGDGLASGMTAYNVNGYSYNDYLKDYFKSTNELQSYNNIFAESDMKSQELIQAIKENKTKNLNNKDITIQQAISDANIITIAIGLDELANLSLDGKVSQKAINDYLENIDDLLKVITNLNKKKIILIGVYKAYNLNDVDEINTKLKDIATSYKCEFLDISKVVSNEEFYFNDSSYYLNYKGHKRISEELKSLI